MDNHQFKQWCLSHSDTRLAPMPLIMGIINVTTDSFSDGGSYFSRDNAWKRVQELIHYGADILDIGGESSRPGALPISEEEELERVIPLIERIRNESTHCISIDTTKPGVMREAIAAGADIVNDISALHNPESLALLAKLQVPVCLMHMQGTPETMQDAPMYPKGVINEVQVFFTRQVKRCLAAGILRENLILDPGFGFGKTPQQNLQLIKYLSVFKEHQLPLMLGVSRKSTIGHVLNKPTDERMLGGVVIHALSIQNGVGIIRTHDVPETQQALTMAHAIMNADN